MWGKSAFLLFVGKKFISKNLLFLLLVEMRSVFLLLVEKETVLLGSKVAVIIKVKKKCIIQPSNSTTGDLYHIKISIVLTKWLSITLLYFNTLYMTEWYYLLFFLFIHSFILFSHQNESSMKTKTVSVSLTTIISASDTEWALIKYLLNERNKNTHRSGCVSMDIYSSILLVAKNWD